MQQRLGIVVWWIGGLFGAAAGLALLVAAALLLIGRADGAINAAVVAPPCLAMTAVCWSISFILAGRFWRPARAEGAE